MAGGGPNIEAPGETLARIDVTLLTGVEKDSQGCLTLPVQAFNIGGIKNGTSIDGPKLAPAEFDLWIER
ncbi:MAG TPA: hypothetical protein VES73_00315 [Lamprocystis sp. (in: g-proteobacteria)]|nr:hypothetical protein [Lamprocystis sp. (in: g-proteobacteria)]